MNAFAHDHLEQAAFHLYASVKPDNGLEWWELSSGQRDDYRLLIAHAHTATAKIDELSEDEIGRDAEDDAYDVAREDAAWGVV